MFPPYLPSSIDLLAQAGVREAVLSPGSRNAPINICLALHPDIKHEMVVDERSAGFYALGKSLISHKPTVLSATSGSAVVNYFPAVTEAFFQEIPLILLTGDRPPETIGQQDGQAIFQSGVFGKHVKASFDFPMEADASAEALAIIRKAYETAMSFPRGPVHINMPFREPFYPPDSIEFTRHDDVGFSIVTPPNPDVNTLQDKINAYDNVLIIAGQGFKNPALEAALRQMAERCAILTEKTSNIHHFPTLQQFDRYLNPALVPDVVISFGGSLVTRKLKNVLRANRPKIHLHIQEAGEAPDVFSSLTDTLHATPEYFFSTVHIEGNKDYVAKWWDLERQQPIISDDFGEFHALKQIIEDIQTPSNLVLGNSLPIRYFPYIPVHPDTKIYANRGVSGIDGLVSTGTGIASTSDRPTWVVTGELGFLYDSNALWKQDIPDNLRIVVLNNQGGGIFRMIKGASTRPEVEEIFAVKHNRTAKPIAKMYGIKYIRVSDAYELNTLNTEKLNKPVIIEIFSNPETDKKIFRQLFPN